MTAPLEKRNDENVFEKWLSPEAISTAQPLSDEEIQAMRRQFRASLNFGHLLDENWLSQTLEHLFHALNLRPGDALFTNRIRRELRQWQGILEEFA